MFDIGFAELIIIGVVALVVIGPERLPGAIRTTSAWVNRLRRSFNDIKQEVKQELHNDEVMRELQQLRDTGDALRRETEAVSSGITDGLKDLNPLDSSTESSSGSAEGSDGEAPEAKPAAKQETANHD